MNEITFLKSSKDFGEYFNRLHMPFTNILTFKTYCETGFKSVSDKFIEFPWIN